MCVCVCVCVCLQRLLKAEVFPFSLLSFLGVKSFFYPFKPKPKPAVAAATPCKKMCVWVFVRVCVRACVRVRARMCVRARACVCVWGGGGDKRAPLP